MQTTPFTRTLAGATAGLAAILLYAGSSAAKTTHAMKPASVATASVSQGKALVSKYRCNSCHSANLMGKPHFSPSLHASGVLKEYNQKTWDRVLNTGVTNDGGQVRRPMPVYHMPAAQANAIYAYLKTQK